MKPLADCSGETEAQSPYLEVEQLWMSIYATEPSTGQVGFPPGNVPCILPLPYSAFLAPLGVSPESLPSVIHEHTELQLRLRL